MNDFSPDLLADLEVEAFLDFDEAEDGVFLLGRHIFLVSTGVSVCETRRGKGKGIFHCVPLAKDEEGLVPQHRHIKATIPVAV